MTEKSKYYIVQRGSYLLLVFDDLFGNQDVIAEQLPSGYVKFNTTFLSQDAVIAANDFLSQVRKNMH
ncbi:hypothetical protein LEQ_0087c [Ligilactobacillus equi DPC 6820]|uniref:Uncharacterized protein n=2 Tax=Ligilactobacillus equi TaxID=137357 RepID=V7HU83_9LACO|nr:hypothetical protein LEQ_0087c [Ligilactobacillus equi DPC 6820]